MKTTIKKDTVNQVWFTVKKNIQTNLFGSKLWKHKHIFWLEIKRDEMKDMV